MRRTALLLAACTALLAPPAAARPHGGRPKGSRPPKVSANGLLKVITPTRVSPVPAHPFVNIIVRFGQASTGAGVDRKTFSARLGRANLTDLFEPIVEDGDVVGLRARVEPPAIHLGRRVSNHLRLSARSLPLRPAKGRPSRPVRDVDRIRFRAEEAADQRPTARAAASVEQIYPGIPVQFDGTASHDPEVDALTYEWDFGDGTTSNDPTPAHTFSDCAGNLIVQLTVSDGQLSDTAKLPLLCTPKCDPGRTPGLLSIAADQALEFGPVDAGTTPTRTFTVSNTDTTAGSQVKAELATDTPGFSVSPDKLDLGPGESAPVTLTFAPTTAGHQSSQVIAVACSANQNAVHLLAHGYVGSAPAPTGPTLASTTLYYLDFIRGPFGILPSGARFFADNTTHTCRDSTGLFTGDVCITDSDCPGLGATCPDSSTCIGGDRALETCTQQTDCPHGVCPSFNVLDPIDFCSDGQGNLYLLSDEGSYTDPSSDPLTELSETVLHVGLDGQGNRTGVDVIERTTTQTQMLACDGGPNGRLYLAEYRNVSGLPDRCFRDALERLVAVNPATGGNQVLVPRIDAVEGYDECNDDIDNSQDLEVVRDGSAVFASLEDPTQGGLFRIWPTPLLITPDIKDFFQVHPDGSVLYVTATDTGPDGLLSLYKISPEQAEHGAPLLSDLTPCATFPIPNNQGRTLIYNSFAADRASPGSLDGIVVVSFTTNGGTIGPSPVLSQNLVLRGTVAFSSPAGASACSVLGVINLEFLDTLTF